LPIKESRASRWRYVIANSINLLPIAVPFPRLRLEISYTS
jgi:hypothetical protein